MRKLYFTLVLLLFIHSTDSYALGIVRIKCADIDIGAKIYFNNAYKGECPADIILDAGSYALLLTRVGGDYEHYIEKNITIVDNVPQRLNLALTESRLTAKAKKRKEDEEKKQRENEFLAQKNAANQGDLQAMRTLADYYQRGYGVKHSEKEAKLWLDKAEKAAEEEYFESLLKQVQVGDVKAMEQLVKIYSTGEGGPLDKEQAEYWQQQLDITNEVLAITATEEDKEKRIAERKKKMMPVSSAFVGWIMIDNEVSSVIAAAFTLSPTIILSAISDLPSVTYQAVKIREIKNEAALRSSAFAQPNSLLAKAQSKSSVMQ